MEMTRETRILIAGIVLNLFVYLGAAIYYARLNIQLITDQRAQFTMVSSRFIVSDLQQARTMARDMVTEYYNGTRTFKEKIIWDERRFYELVEVANNKRHWPDYLLKLPFELPIPHELLKAEQFDFIRYGSDKNLYLTTTSGPIEYGEAEDILAPYPHIFTFRVNTKMLNDVAKQSNFNYTIVEYNESGRTQLIFSNLKEEDTTAVLSAMSNLDHERLKKIGNIALTQSGYKAVIRTALSGTKAIVFPMPVSLNKKIRQLFYFVMPLANYRQIDEQSIFLVVIAVFTMAFGFLCVGFSIGTSKEKQAIPQ